MIAATVVVLFLRRPDQFLHPYIWVEEGRYVLREYLENGYWVLAKPLAGYSQLASKIIALISFKTSILWAPEIAVFLTISLTAAIVCAVAFSPTHLRYKSACALACLLVPSGSEVFAVSAYAFWWAGILVLLALMWDASRGMEWLRLLYIVIGGLSAPIIISLSALFWLRAIVIERSEREVIAAGIASLIAVAQIIAIHHQPVEIHAATISISAVALSAQKFVGNFFYLNGGVLFGFGVGAAIAGWAFSSRQKIDRYFVLLGLAFVLLCASVAARMTPDELSRLHPVMIAPRYFFYPFILLSWILLWLSALSPRWVRRTAGAVFILSILLVNTGLSRRHDAVDWRAQLTACANAPGPHNLSYHYIGSANEMWTSQFTGGECRQLLDRSVF